MSPPRSRSPLVDALAVARTVGRGVRLFAGWKLAVAAVVVAVPALMLGGFFMAASGASVASGSEEECRVVGDEGGEVPANYVPWLEKAATKYKLGARGFSIVAGIHYVESDFGRSPLPGVAPGSENSAGAMGPGEFLQASWEMYGQDADGDGVKDVYGIPDSIYGTANYLRHSGAPKDWHAAIFAYNHAEWYVEKVFAAARKFQGRRVCTFGLGEVPTETVARIEYVARWIESRRIHYCWGGGHGLRPGPSEGSGEFCPPGTKGLDCSGSVRWLLVLAGYPDPGGLASDGLGAHYPAGPGRAVTLWANADHIFVEINGRTWGTSSSNPSNGPGFAAHTTTGFLPSHPRGL